MPSSETSQPATNTRNARQASPILRIFYLVFFLVLGGWFIMMTTRAFAPAPAATPHAAPPPPIATTTPIQYQAMAHFWAAASVDHVVNEDDGYETVEQPIEVVIAVDVPHQTLYIRNDAMKGGDATTWSHLNPVSWNRQFRGHYLVMQGSTNYPHYQEWLRWAASHPNTRITAVAHEICRERIPLLVTPDSQTSDPYEFRDACAAFPDVHHTAGLIDGPTVGLQGVQPEKPEGWGAREDKGDDPWVDLQEQQLKQQAPGRNRISN